jgi:hypothetical protein
VFADPGVIYGGVAQVHEGSNNGGVGDVCRTFYSWVYQRVSTVFGILFSVVVSSCSSVCFRKLRLRMHVQLYSICSATW